MLDKIVHELHNRPGLRAWSVRQVNGRGVQLYAVPANLEAARQVIEERYLLTVQVDTSRSPQEPSCGDGNITLLPGDDIPRAIDLAALIASQVHNPPYIYPGPVDAPDVALVDESIRSDPAGVLEAVFSELRQAAAQPSVRLAAAEGFLQEEQIHFRNSLGIDCAQVATRMEVEFVLHSRKDGRETEAFREISRRRAGDLRLAGAVEGAARQALDLFDASPPEDYHGPLLLQGEALADFLNGGVLQFLSSAEARFAKITPWELGQPVLRSPVKGDPLTVWANRRLPYGVHASRFDEEGLPGQRLLLIEEGRLANYWAHKRHADYLSLPASGDFGDLELPPGQASAADLLAGPHVEVVQFSWFNPDPVTGDFASEIRFGYRVQDGRRRPIKGGMLVGNVLDALADVRWSRETGFFGSYQGPGTARFEELGVSAG